MKNILYYAISILSFFCTFNLYAIDSGYLWMPLTWEFSFDKKKSDFETIKFKSVKLSFLDIENGKTIYTKLNLKGKKLSQLKLDEKNNRISFYSDKLMKVPIGKYEFIGVVMEMYDKNEDIFNMDVKFPNPYQKNTNKKENLSFVISKNKITPFPSFSVETSMSILNSIVRKSSYIDIIEDDFISGSLIFSYLSQKSLKIPKNSSSFVIVNPNFPPLQIPGSALKVKNFKYLGLILDISCATNGALKLVWVNKSDPYQYVFYNTVTKKKKNCKVHEVVPLKFYLPNGSWTLQSMTMVTDKVLHRDYNTELLDKMNKFAISYFKLNDRGFTSLNLKERNLLKIIELNLAGIPDTSGLYFLGSSEITTPQHKSEGENLKFYFKRNYEIIEIKKLFGVKRIYNAYTGEILKKDRIIGDVQVKVIYNGDEYSRKKQENYLNELKSFSTGDLAKCIIDQEVEDPLVSLNGKINLVNKKMDDNKLLVTERDFNFVNKGISQDKIVNCMIKKFKKYKFKKSISGSLKAIIQFESY